MKRIRRLLPQHMWTKRQMAGTLAFTAVFAFATIVVSIPVSGGIWWSSLPHNEFFIWVAAFFLICAVLLVPGRMIMLWHGKTKGLTIPQYIHWCLVEMVIVALMYGAVTKMAIGAGHIVPEEETTFFHLVYNLFVKSIPAMGIPYAIVAMYQCMDDKTNTFRLTDFGEVETDTPPKPYDYRRITLFDSNGAMKLSVDSDNLYFIESDDNYIKVWYSDTSGQMKQYMLRCPMKTVEESFAGSDLVRCHRKYIVNITKVRILKSGREGFKATLDLENIDPIPISKTYEANVLARFNSRQ